MSEPLDVVRALLAGDPAASRELLPAARADAFGAEAFGAAWVAELLARQARPLSPDPHVVATETGLAVLDAGADGRVQAVVADIYDGRIGRLWRLGDGETDAIAEPALTVAADDFMTQLRDEVAADPADHPALDPAAWAPLIQVGRSLVRSGVDENVRSGQARAFAVRAISAGDRAAALFAVRRNTGAAARAVSQTWVAAAFRFHDGALLHQTVVVDAVPQPRPRLRL